MSNTLVLIVGIIGMLLITAYFGESLIGVASLVVNTIASVIGSLAATLQGVVA